jgi:hypothetical protein
LQENLQENLKGPCLAFVRDLDHTETLASGPLWRDLPLKGALMTKPVVLAIIFLLLPALSAGAASSLQRKHTVQPKATRVSEPPAVPAAPPVTRLPVAPDTFRA